MTAPRSRLAALKDICLDANDVRAVAGFWAQVLGYESKEFDWGGIRLTGDGLPIWVNPVGEGKAVKNRMHVDVLLDGGDVQPLLDLGATLLRAPGDDIDWWVLEDVEGNEFCAFARD